MQALEPSGAQVYHGKVDNTIEALQLVLAAR